MTASAPVPAPVAGDFFALLERNRLALPRLEAGSRPVETQATTVFAFHCADGVLVAGDRRATAGTTIVTETVEKVVELDRTSVLAIAGVPATAFEMARALQTAFEYYRRSQLQPLSLPARIRALSRALRDNLALTLQGVGLVAPIFVGLDTSSPRARPVIHFYDPLGAQFEATEFAASGSGAPSIRSILGFQHRFGSPAPSHLPLRAAVRLALQLLMTASDFDTATGGVNPGASRFATLVLVTPDGLRRIGEREQAAAAASPGEPEEGKGSPS